MGGGVQREASYGGGMGGMGSPAGLFGGGPSQQQHAGQQQHGYGGMQPPSPMRGMSAGGMGGMGMGMMRPRCVWACGSKWGLEWDVVLTERSPDPYRMPTYHDASRQGSFGMDGGAGGVGASGGSRGLTSRKGRRVEVSF